MNKQKAQEQHKKNLFNFAAEIEKLVIAPAIMASFRNQIETFWKMVVSYDSQPDKKNAQNPFHWFRPTASLRPPLNDKERMMVNYVMLAVIHDNQLKPQWKRIYSGLGNLKVGPRFTAWANNSLWPWLRVWSYDRNKTHIEIYEDSVQEAKTIRTEIQLALEYVNADLAEKQAEIQQSQRTEIPSEIKLLDQVTDKLEEWAKRIEPKLPAHIGHISFYGSLLKALGNLPDLMLTFLRSHMPEQLDSIQKDLDDLYEKAKAVDHERSESSGEANILKCQAQAAATRLAKKLSLMEGIVESHREQIEIREKPAEEKNKGSIKRLLKIIGAIVGFFAALLTCIYLLWWLWTNFLA